MPQRYRSGEAEAAARGPVAAFERALPADPLSGQRPRVAAARLGVATAAWRGAIKRLLTSMCGVWRRRVAVWWQR